jgi:N-acetylneuraminic acid mutarotase
MHRRFACFVVALVLTPACSLQRGVTATNAQPDSFRLDGGGTDAPSDSGRDGGDARTPDLGMPDSHVGDAGMSDAGMSDAGMSDAGMSDAGMSDAGMSDAGMSDAFVPPVDVGVDAFVPPVDVGVDAFVPPMDAGVDMFVPPPDMGTDGGACGACTSTQTCCSMTCVDTTSDPANCGSCGHACHGMQTCNASRCVGWAPIASTGAPTGRSQHTAVWTGTQMIVWGGTSATGELNTGGVYDPATDTWTATTMTSVPNPRRGHAAVWTGTRMVVWGGYDTGMGWLQDAASYDPVANTWTALPMTGAPSARSRFAYAWDDTQSELIVFAGWTGTMLTGTPILANDASRFNLAMWAGTAATGLNARYYLPGFMTGTGAATRFLVWGGEQANGTTLQTGARYDPATNMWSNMTNSNRPTTRSRYVGVTTGTTIVVWGGWSGTAVRNDGGLYDPTADSWTTLANVLTGFNGRTVSTAVWTGTEMVVFGGSDDPNYGGTAMMFNDSAAYATAGNAWRAVSGANAPSARGDHTAVWTGTEMIVWGGRDLTNVALSDGARITP